MIDHYADLTKKEKRPQKEKPLFKPLKRIQVNLPPSMKRLFICVYFGSTTDFSQPRFSVKEVAQLFRMPISTAAGLLRQFRTSACDLCCFNIRCRPRFKMLAESTKKLLLDPNILQQWSAYSIKERVKLLEERYQTKISKNRLTAFYRENGVRYRQLKKVYRESLVRQPMLTLQRAVFAVKYAEAVMTGRQILHFDESSCNNWSSKQKTWSLVDQHNVAPINKERFSATIFGTVGKGLRQPKAFRLFRTGGSSKEK